MSKIIATLVVILSFALNVRSAQAAIADCASQGCVAVCTHTGPVYLYFNDGTLAGTINGTGTGQCWVSASEGYLIITRDNDNSVRIYDVATEQVTCFSTPIGGGMLGLIYDGYAYVVGNGDNVHKIDVNCGSSVSIPVGTSPFGITKNSNTIYVLNYYSANISTIVHPAETSSIHPIGRVQTDYIGDIRYHAGTNKLYVSGWDGIYRVNLPFDGTSVLWKTTSQESGEMDLVGDTLLVGTNANNSAFLIDIYSASPTADATLECDGCSSVALSDTTAYTVDGSIAGVRTWDYSGNFTSQLTTAVSWSADYLWPTVTCGDNTREGAEICDGTDLNGQTCVSQGFAAGTLACNAGCTAFDTTSCTMCGNDSVDSGEDCDGADLGADTCVTLGHDAGTLTCTSSCTYDETGCINYECGNDIVEGNEQCDGANLNGQTCASLALGTGNLGCTGSCTFDTSNCSIQPVCGNGTREGAEECDNGTANSDTEPNACRTDCTNPRCGDHVTDSGEECDDGNSVAGDGCDSCTIEIPPTCGNGTYDDGEQCDDTDLNGATCVSIAQGFTGGSLACTTGCTFDTSSCTTTSICEEALSSGLVTILNDPIEHPDLIGDSLTTYQRNLDTLSKGECTPTCVETLDEWWIEVKTTADSLTYCTVQVEDPDGAWNTIEQIYTNSTGTTAAYLRIPVTHPSDQWRWGGNHVFLHDGEDIVRVYGRDRTLSAGTAGTGEVAESPDSDNPDEEWIELNMTSHAMKYCPLVDGAICGTMIAGLNHKARLNLKNLGLDLSKIGTTPVVPPKPTCNGCSSASGADPANLILVLVILGFLSWMLWFSPRQKEAVRSNSVQKRR